MIDVLFGIKQIISIEHVSIVAVFDLLWRRYE